MQMEDLLRRCQIPAPIPGSVQHDPNQISNRRFSEDDEPGGTLCLDCTGKGAWCGQGVTMQVHNVNAEPKSFR